MNCWTIESLPLYRFVSPGPEVLFQRGFGEMIEMVIYAFLLRCGRITVLVDSGLPDEFSALNQSIRSRKGEAAGFHPTGPRLVERLAGVSIDSIALTSFGPYAVGGLEGFPGVPAVASARGLADLERPEEPALYHALPRPVSERLRAARRVDGEAKLYPGLDFIETGVHHPASAALVIETAHGRVAIADPIFVARNLTEGLALGASEHAAGWHRMARLLGERADAIIPIHDVEPTPIGRGSWHPWIQPVQ